MARMNVARHRGTINLASMIRRRTPARSLLLLLFRQSGNEAVVFSFFPSFFFPGKSGAKGRASARNEKHGKWLDTRETFQTNREMRAACGEINSLNGHDKRIIVLTESRES